MLNVFFIKLPKTAADFFFGMLFEKLFEGFHVVPYAIEPQTHKDDAAMRLAIPEHQIAEIGIVRQHDPFLVNGKIKNLFIAHPKTRVRDAHHVVALVSEIVNDAAANILINEKFHFVVRMRWMNSCGYTLKSLISSVA